MTEAAQAEPRAGEERLSPALVRIAGAIMLGAIVVQLDGTMVNVAFDTFIKEFHSTLSSIQWIGTGYLLAMSMVIPLTGWSVARFGTRNTWMFTIALFLLGSLLCSVAWSAGSLIAFRVLQGLGGGLIVPLAQVILAQAAGQRLLGRAMAAIGIPSLLGPVLGPVLGGVIIQELSWRWIFLVNLPVCLLGLWVSWRVMPDLERPPGGAGRLDVLGLLLISPGCVALVYGLAEAGNKGGFGHAKVYVPLVAGAVLIVAFVVNAAVTRAVPLIDLTLFRSASFSLSSAVVFLAALPLFGSMALMPLYYQTVRHFSVLHAGLLFAPFGLGMGLALVASGVLADKMGPRNIVVVGLLVGTGGTAILTQVQADTSVWLLSLALVIIGAGLGASLVPPVTAALRGLGQAEIPRATTAVRIFQQLGGSFGLAVLFVVLQQAISDHTSASGGPSRADLAAAYGHTFWWMLALIAVVVLPALCLPGGKLPSPEAAMRGPRAVPPLPGQQTRGAGEKR